MYILDQNDIENQLDLQILEIDEEITKECKSPIHNDNQEFLKNQQINQKICINNQNSYIKQFEDFSVYLTQGGKSTNQDSFSYVEYINDDFTEKMFCLFDGHQNSQVSKYLSEYLPSKIFNHSLYQTDSILAIKQTFQETNQYLNSFLENKDESGSTALILIIKKFDFLLINLGDSTAQMVSEKRGVQKKKIKKLNKVHRTTCQKECDRIEKQGGWIIKVKKILRVQGQLQVTRAFGDLRYQPYISSDPDIYVVNKNKKQSYLVLGTDGFWDQINDETVLNNIDDLYKRPDIIEKLIERNYGYIKDNLSLLIIKLQ